MPRDLESQSDRGQSTQAGTRGKAKNPDCPCVAAAQGWIQKCMAHSVFVGPLLGLFAQLYLYHLARTAPLRPHPALHQTIRNIAYFQGHARYAFYTTAMQSAVFWLLAGPACLWLIGLVLVLSVRGLRLAHRRH